MIGLFCGIAQTLTEMSRENWSPLELAVLRVAMVKSLHMGIGDLPFKN
jgi:hypothetical protein